VESSAAINMMRVKPEGWRGFHRASGKKEP
jgi:hypothetical protein